MEVSEFAPAAKERKDSITKRHQLGGCRLVILTRNGFCTEQVGGRLSASGRRSPQSSEQDPSVQEKHARQRHEEARASRTLNSEVHHTSPHFAGTID